MYLGVPQIIVMCLLLMSFCVNLVKHGEDKGKYNAGTSLIDMFVTIALLYWGGFFAN